MDIRKGVKRSYHSLLPRYLQDVLRSAVSGSCEEKRFLDVGYMAGIEYVIHKVKRAYPQAYTSEDAACGCKASCLAGSEIGGLRRGADEGSRE